MKDSIIILAYNPLDCIEELLILHGSETIYDFKSRTLRD